MTSKKFFSLYKGIAGPEHRGTPYPPFEPTAINESRFADGLRLKEYSIKYDEKRQRIVVFWDSQSWDDDTDSLKREVRRCFHHIGFRGEVVLNLAKRGDRGIPDGCHAYIRFRVGDRLPKA